MSIQFHSTSGFGLFLLFGIMHFVPNLLSQSLTIQERLGYPIDAKLVILHADDFGVSHAENRATIDLMEAGMINSASAMVPCSWFNEVAAYARQHPEADIGLHLTLSSEWNIYKWKPVSPVSQVPSLVDSQGNFHPGWGGLPDLKLEEIEIELRAQIEKAMALGVHPSHLDTHMFQLFRKPEYLKIYLKIGRAYHLPVLLNKEMIETYYGYDISPYLTSRDVIVDQIYGAFPEDYQLGMEVYYSRVLRLMTPGLHYVYLHPAFEDPEMKAMTEGHIDWGADWRYQDYSFFKSQKAQEIIREENIILITWREIKDRLFAIDRQ